MPLTVVGTPAGEPERVRPTPEGWPLGQAAAPGGSGLRAAKASERAQGRRDRDAPERQALVQQVQVPGQQAVVQRYSEALVRCGQGQRHPDAPRQTDQPAAVKAGC
ncbi:MAG TPA: hypothetical protein VN327_11745 [Pseudonocardiaceae bacterium]|nr:hypothetical protein [Pseudonocardiaceae bacterium]